MSNKLFFETNNMQWDTVGEGVSRQIMGYDDKIMLVHMKFAKDAVGALHTHPHSQTSYIVKGSFEVTVGEKKQILASGDSFYAPPNELHGVLCLEEGVLIDVFSPKRDDFLDGEKLSYYGK
ncbi:MAG: cupin domain-containing protein [Bacteroidales bacterium]